MKSITNEMSSPAPSGMFQCTDGAGDERMGRVPRPTSQVGQWLHGVTSLLGVHRQDPQSHRLSGHLRDSAGLRRAGQGHDVLHDLSTATRQSRPLLQQRPR